MPPRRSGKKSARRSPKKSARRSPKKSARRSPKKSARRSPKKSAHRSPKKSAKRSARRSAKRSARRSPKKSKSPATSARRSGKQYHGLFTSARKALFGPSEDENAARTALEKVKTELLNKDPSARLAALIDYFMEQNVEIGDFFMVNDKYTNEEALEKYKDRPDFDALSDFAKELQNSSLYEKVKSIFDDIDTIRFSSPKFVLYKVKPYVRIEENEKKVYTVRYNYLVRLYQALRLLPNKDLLKPKNINEDFIGRPSPDGAAFQAFTKDLLNESDHDKQLSDLLDYFIEQKIEFGDFCPGKDGNSSTEAYEDRSDFSAISEFTDRACATDLEERLYNLFEGPIGKLDTLPDSAQGARRLLPESLISYLSFGYGKAKLSEKGLYARRLLDKLKNSMKKNAYIFVPKFFRDNPRLTTPWHEPSNPDPAQVEANRAASRAAYEQEARFAREQRQLDIENRAAEVQANRAAQEQANRVAAYQRQLDIAATNRPTAAQYASLRLRGINV